MNTIAENTTIVTRKLFDEGMTVANSYHTYALKWIGALGVLWLLLAGFGLFVSGTLGFALFELVLLLAAAVWMLVILPRRQFKRAFAALEQKTGGDMARTITFYETECVVEGSGIYLQMDYEDVLTIKRSRNLLVLSGEEKTAVMAALDGFTKGDADTVIRQIEAVRNNEI